MFKSKTGRFLLDHELSFLMFKRNYQSFLKASEISAYYMAVKLDMPGGAEDKCIDALRYFYNFLMSAATLIDHYRVATQSSSFPAQFKTDYEAKIALFFHNDLLAAIIKKLRNMTTHRSLPSTFVKRDDSSGKSGGNPYRLFLDVADLLTWDQWNVKEKAFLNSLKSDEDAAKFSEPYFRKTEEFYRWFMQEYCIYFPNEKKDLSSLFEPL
jgi:hypothetical protein